DDRRLMADGEGREVVAEVRRQPVGVAVHAERAADPLGEDAEKLVALEHPGGVLRGGEYAADASHVGREHRHVDEPRVHEEARVGGGLRGARVPPPPAAPGGDPGGPPGEGGAPPRRPAPEPRRVDPPVAAVEESKEGAPEAAAVGEVEAEGVGGYRGLLRLT